MNLNTGGWASPLLRLVTRLRSDGVNSTTPVTEINGGTISATNADIALIAKGTGATLAQVPDGTAVGGNKRGTYATDLQKARSVASQVASGSASVISGGQENINTGSWSSIGGGLGNTVSNTTATIAGGSSNTASGDTAAIAGGGANQSTGSYSFIGGGQSNTASSSRSFVGGGQSNTASTNSHATICGGSTNTASGQYSFVGSGLSNTASVNHSVIGGGGDNTANSQYGVIPGGRYGNTRGIQGYFAFPACNGPVSAVNGVSQGGLLVLGTATADATATVLRSNSSAASTVNQVILPNNAAYSFSGEVIAGVTAAGNTARWTIDGAIKRGANAASTAMVGTPTVIMTHFDAGAATWVVAVTADTTNGGIKVEVTGALATTIRWVCRINTVEMTY